MADHGEGNYGVEVTWKMMTSGVREKTNYWYESERLRDAKLKSFKSKSTVHEVKKIGR